MSGKWQVREFGPIENATESGLTQTQVRVGSCGSWAGPDLTVLGGLGVEYRLDWESTREPKMGFHSIRDQTG